MKMTAAVMYEQGLPAPYVESEPFRIEEVELEAPGPEEVLVEVRGAGLCHSDLSQVAGLRKRKVPVVGGHEGAGVVLDVGRDVKGLKPGDHVVMTAVSGCGACRPCFDSRPVLCDTFTAARSKGLLADGYQRLSHKGTPLFHYSGISSFAQFAVTMPGTLIKIDATVPLDVAAMFGCAVLTGAGCVFNTARVRPGQSVAIFGLGGVGLNAVMAARLSGASHIIGIDINEAKFPLALSLGCTHTLSALDPELAEKVRALTRGGVDYSFEVSASKSALASAYAITAKGGEVICVGLGASTDQGSFPQAALVTEEKAIRGSYMGGCVPPRDLPRYIQYYMEGRMPVNKLMSGAMRFSELNVNLDRLAKGDVVRQVLLPHEG